MKILYFHQHFSTRSGSWGTRSYEFARELLRRGHQVTMVCGQSDRAQLDLAWDAAKKWHRGMVDGIDVIALPVAYSNHDGIARRAIAFLRFAARSAALGLTWDYDLMFATSTPLTAGIPGIVMKLLGRGKPFVFEVRDLWPELPRALGMKNPALLGGMSILEWLSYRCADACIALSPGIAAGIAKRSRASQRIVVIPNGSDVDLFHPGSATKPSLPGIAAGDFTALFAGAHGPANGLDRVLDAAAVLQERGRVDIKLVLIGDGREKSRLIERARKLELKNCLFFPPVPKTELAQMLGCFDCGLMVLANVPAFYFGTSPNKFFDYLAAGLPVLNNYPGWVAELIREARCGTVVPPDDPAAFAAALCALADDPEKCQQFGANARTLALSRFGREKLAAAFGEFLESVAAH